MPSLTCILEPFPDEKVVHFLDGIVFLFGKNDLTGDIIGRAVCTTVRTKGKEFLKTLRLSGIVADCSAIELYLLQRATARLRELERASYTEWRAMNIAATPTMYTHFLTECYSERFYLFQQE